MKLSRRESLTALVAGVLAPLIGWRVFGLEQPHETFKRVARREITKRGFIVDDEDVYYASDDGDFRCWGVVSRDPLHPDKGCGHVIVTEKQIMSAERRISMSDLAKLRTKRSIETLIRFGREAA